MAEIDPNEDEAGEKGDDNGRCEVIEGFGSLSSLQSGLRTGRERQGGGSRTEGRIKSVRNNSEGNSKARTARKKSLISCVM